MRSSLVFVCENTSGLYNIFSAGLSPWDLLWIPNVICTQHSITSSKGSSSKKIRTNCAVLLPDAKNCNSLLTKEKGLRILNLHVLMLPLAMNTVVLEHVGLLHQTNKQPLIIQQLLVRRKKKFGM